MPPRVLLFVPAYNCEKQIRRVIERLQASQTLPWLEEILIINDCSKDNTLVEALKACPNQSGWTVASMMANAGLGGVHKAAFSYAIRNGFSHAMVLHGDDQGNIDDILPLLQSGDYLRYDALLGSRFMAGSVLEGYSRVRILGNHVFNAMFSGALRKRVLDLGAGLNVFGENIMRSIHIEGMADDLTFNVHLLVKMLSGSQGVTSRFFPVTWREDDQVSNVRLVSQTLKTARIVLGAAFAPDDFLGCDHRPRPRTYEMVVDFRGAS